MHGVTTERAGIATVDHAQLCIRISVGSGETTDIVCCEIGGINTTCATCRGEESYTVYIVSGAVAIIGIVLIACGKETNLVIGQRVKSCEGEGRLCYLYLVAGTTFWYHLNGNGWITCLIPCDGDTLTFNTIYL